tara:strand:- start:142 stop:1167 length:1026 start_codon:yes stop_codon:yes gene_type:complete
MKTRKIIVDLDNTITIEDPNVPYENKDSNDEVIDTLKNIPKEDILIFTARNMRSFNGNLEKINTVTKPIAEEWLKKQKIQYDEIIMGKPWCGEDGFYVDDKNLSIDEFNFRFAGPYSKYEVDVVIPFFNEEKNIASVHKNQTKLNALFNINKYIYVNNGSIDKTSKMLNELAAKDKKIEVVEINKNIGYGAGMKAGIKKSNARFIITNHADGQFDAYTFFMTHLKDISSINLNIIPERYNRGPLDSLNSFILRLLISLIRMEKTYDFNGQPKLIESNQIVDIDDYPDDFTFDFFLYKNVYKNFQALPIIQKRREHGISSWSGSIVKRIKIFLGYIFEAFRR